MRGSHVADGESIDTEDKDLGLHIRAVPLFSTWPESALSALRKGARLTSAPAGSTVILQTYPVPGVYSIVEGSIEVGSTQAAGRRFIRRFAKPGTWMERARHTHISLTRRYCFSTSSERPCSLLFPRSQAYGETLRFT